MAIRILVPRLGWNMEEGTFVGWLKKDGDFVQAGEMLFELESEKATQEVEAVDSGILRIPADAPQPGQMVPVGATLGYLVAEGEPAPEGVAGAPEPSEPRQPAAASTAEQPAREAQDEAAA